MEAATIRVPRGAMVSRRDTELFMKTISLLSIVGVIVLLSSARAEANVVGIWEFERCEKTDQPRDRLEFRTLPNGGLSLRQILPGGMNPERQFEFHATPRTYQIVTGRTPEHPLERTVKTRLLNGVPVLASIWTNQQGGEADSFLSSNIGIYETVDDGNRLRLTNRWTSVDASPANSVTAASGTDFCFYRRFQEN